MGFIKRKLVLKSNFNNIVLSLFSTACLGLFFLEKEEWRLKTESTEMLGKINEKSECIMSRNENISNK